MENVVRFLAVRPGRESQPDYSRPFPSPFRTFPRLRLTGHLASPGRIRALLEELLDVALDGPSPDVVALGAQMQVVRHDLNGQAALLVQELLPDVLVEDGLTVVQVGDDGVDGRDFHVQLGR